MRLSRRTAVALIAMAVVVAAAVGVIWRIHSSKHPVDTATVYAGYLAPVAIAVTLLMALGAWWWKRWGAGAQVSTPAQAAAAADRLAEVMAARWRLEATGRRIVTPAPATVRWRWAADEVTAPRLEVATPPAAGTGPPALPDLRGPGEPLGSGVVTRLHDEIYGRLPHGRLVLLGGPGAGKTGAMILLLLAALDRRASLADDQRARMPVPVWLTLGGWNPATTPLQEWAAATMNRDYPALRAPDYGPDAARELLRAGRVALFLDGLDEMPEGVRGQALKRVDEEASGLRVVVTSRPDEYRRALHVGRPDNTAVIELRPIRPAAAAAYLLHGQAGPNRQRWEQVGAYLTQNPDSVAARALDNPLTLSLARDTYASHNPFALTKPGRFPTVDAIRKHLIDQVLMTAYPGERQREHATQWLAWIAHHMGTNRNLAWWDIPTWIPQWRLRLTRGLALGLPVGLTVGLTFGLTFGLRAGLRAGLAFGLVTGLGAELGAGVGLWREPRTIFFPQRPPRPHDLGRILVSGSRVGLAFGLVTGLVTGLGTGLFFALIGFGPSTVLFLGPVTGLGTGLFFVFMIGLFNLWTTPIANSPSATAVGTYRAARRISVLFWLGLGFFLVLVLVLGTGLGSMPLVFGLGCALAVAAIPQVPLVKFTELVLACQGRGKVHFGRLLEDAFDRQVLRQAGTVYQFRHATLQDHLAAMYYQLPTTSNSAWPGPSLPGRKSLRSSGRPE